MMVSQSNKATKLISLDEVANYLLSADKISSRIGGGLFFQNATVMVFDGLIVWKGDLNMEAAIPALTMLQNIVGLPVAVVEDGSFGKLKKRKFRAGKHVGPGNWAKNSWDSVFGLDSAFLKEYTDEGKLRPYAYTPRRRNVYHGGARFAHQEDEFSNQDDKLNKEDDEFEDLYNDDPMMWGYGYHG